MFESYLDFVKSGAPHQLVCSTALLGDAHGSGALSHRWRHLLLKHELPYVSLADWRRVASARGWDRETQKAILGQFANSVLNNNFLCLTVVLETDIWRSFGSRKKRLYGSELAFCYQRLLRLILDKLEAAGRGETLAIVVERDIDRLVDQAGDLTVALKADTRSVERIASVRFADFTRSACLQASSLIGAMALRTVVMKSAGRLQSPTRMSSFRVLPPMPDGTTFFEHWDDEHSARFLSTLNWSAGDAERESNTQTRRR